MNYDIQLIDKVAMAEFVKQHHYSSVMPRITRCAYGGFKEADLKAAVSFGFGSRPLHTIRAMFPTLSTPDYLEVGKLCLDDTEPKNSESWFLSRTFKILAKHQPLTKLVFSWADGMWGKPGYIYQASNFLYGGFIWTDSYRMADGKRIHPLQIQSFLREQGIQITQRTLRPSLETMERIGWQQFRGKQFRYIRPLQPLDFHASPFRWDNSGYPKNADCEWMIRTPSGWVASENPVFTGTWLWLILGPHCGAYVRRKCLTSTSKCARMVFTI